MNFKLALRNLLRNRRRTMLTVGGVAAAVAIVIWILALIAGMNAMMVRGATSARTGQVQIQSAAYVDEASIYNAFAASDELLADVRRTDGVQAASPRVQLYGLVGTEKRSRVAQLVGIEPDAERATTTVSDGVVEGAWLSTKSEDRDPAAAPTPVVIGSMLATQLEVGVGDELVTFLQASDGSLGNDLFEIVGIVETGNTYIDRQTVFVPLDAAQYLGALEGKLHEIAVKTDPNGAVEVSSRLGEVLAGRPAAAATDDAKVDKLVSRSWQEVHPMLSQMIQASDSSNWFMVLIIGLVAAIGVFNTQRMSALERRREFAVMMAIGMIPRRLFEILLAEGLIIGVVGGVIGANIGIAIAYYHDKYGLNLQAFSEESFTYMGVSFSDRMHAALTTDIVVEAFVAMFVVTVVSTLWPAIKAMKLNITASISGR